MLISLGTRAGHVVTLLQVLRLPQLEFLLILYVLAQLIATRTLDGARAARILLFLVIRVLPPQVILAFGSLMLRGLEPARLLLFC